MAKYQFYTHGVSAVVQNEVAGGLVVHRSDMGTQVRQPANTENWFHLAIPTPSQIAGDTSIYLKQVVLRASTNDSAKIDKIHVRHQHVLAEDMSVSLIGGDHDITVPVVPVIEADRGVCVSIHVKFLPGTAMGELQLKSAGGIFDTVAS